MTPESRSSLFSLPQPLRELAERTGALARGPLLELTRSAPAGKVCRPLLARLGSEGLLDQAIGGQRSGDGTGKVSVLALCLIRETLAQHCTAAETAFALQGLGAHPIMSAGGPALVERWGEPLAGGEAVAAFALSEPLGGSDAAHLSLAADRDGDGYRLTGTKTWISNAPEADVYVVFARTGPQGSNGITAFAVAGDADGLAGTPLDMLSPHPIGRLDFDGVRVSDADRIGPLNGGFAVALTTLNCFRPSVGGFAVGMGQAALDLALDYTAGRQAFGRSLSDFQAISHRLAEAATQLEAARLLVYRAGAVADERGTPDHRLSAMAKLFATEVAQEIVDSAIQFHGAVALETGHPLEHLYREVRAPRIYEGASEVQREIIARSLYRQAASADPEEDER